MIPKKPSRNKNNMSCSCNLHNMVYSVTLNLKIIPAIIRLKDKIIKATAYEKPYI